MKKLFLCVSIMCFFTHFTVKASDELKYFNYDDDTEVMNYYKSSKKKEHICIAATVILTPFPLFALCTGCVAAEYAESYKIYKLLKAARDYIKDYSNQPKVLKKFFNNLVATYPHEQLILKEVAERLNKYADMPIGDKKTWQAKSGQYNKTQLMNYLFKTQHNHFDSHYQEQELIFNQILR